MSTYTDADAHEDGHAAEADVPTNIPDLLAEHTRIVELAATDLPAGRDAARNLLLQLTFDLLRDSRVRAAFIARGRNQLLRAAEYDEIRDRADPINGVPEDDDKLTDEMWSAIVDTWSERFVREQGGAYLIDNSNKTTKWWAVPLVPAPYEIVETVTIRHIDGDGEVFLEERDETRTVEPPVCEAELKVLTREKRGIPEPVSAGRIPFPRLRLHTRPGEFRYQVLTPQGAYVVITNDDLDKPTRWVGRSAGRLPGNPHRANIMREGFSALAERAPMEKPKATVSTSGNILLPPQGVNPPGFQEESELPTGEALRLWADWCRLAATQPRGALAHLAGAVVDSFYLGAGNRQSHTVDVWSRDVATGKSTGARCVSAMFGDPSETCMPFDLASAISATTLFAQVNCGTVTLDESQLFQKPEEEKAMAVFRTANGAQRTRARTDGQAVTRSERFNGMQLITGNARFVSEETIEKLYPGLGRRYLEMSVTKDHPMTIDDPTARRLEDMTRQAYGHLVPHVLRRVTTYAHERAVTREWEKLREAWTAVHPEVLRLLAGHIAGAVAIDRALELGSVMGPAARTRISTWLEDFAPELTPIHEVFLRKVRSHLESNILRWPEHIDYAIWREPGKIQDAVDASNGAEEIDVQGASYRVRDPLGLRFRDEDRFVVLTDGMDKLCADHNLNKDAVLVGLRDVGLLHHLDGKLINQVGVSVAGVRVRFVGYDIHAPWQRDGENDHRDGDGGGGGGGGGNDGGGGSGLTPEPEKKVTEPKKAAAKTAEPKATVTAERPAWLPKPLPNPKGPNNKVIATVNALLELQDKRSQATLHKQSYPRTNPEKLPAPLRLIAKGEGTRTHEGYHRFDVTRTLDPETVVTRLDRNGAYLSAIGQTNVPIVALVPADEPMPGRPGLYRLAGAELPAYRGDGPHPLGFVGPKLEGQPIWITEPTRELIREVVGAGLMDEPEIVETYAAEVLRPGEPTAMRLSAMYRALSTARDNAIASGDTDAEKYLKQVYAQFVSTSGESVSNTRIWRPDVVAFIRAKAYANAWRMSKRITDAGLRVVALKNNDEIHVAATPDQVFAAVHPDGKPAVVQGLGLAEIKVKDTYRAGDDPKEEEF